MMIYTTIFRGLACLATLICITEAQASQHTFKADIETCGDRDLQPYADQTFVLATRCGRLLNRLRVNGLNFDRHKYASNLNYNARLFWGVDNIEPKFWTRVDAATDTADDELAAALDRAQNDQERDQAWADFNATDAIGANQGYRQASRDVLKAANTSLLHVGDRLSGRPQPLELPTFCHGRSFIKTKFAADVSHEQPSVMTVAGLTRGTYQAAFIHRTSSSEYIHFTLKDSDDVCEGGSARLTNAHIYGAQPALILCGNKFFEEAKELTYQRYESPNWDRLDTPEYWAAVLIRELVAIVVPGFPDVSVYATDDREKRLYRPTSPQDVAHLALQRPDFEMVHNDRGPGLEREPKLSDFGATFQHYCTTSLYPSIEFKVYDEQGLFDENGELDEEAVFEAQPVRGSPVL